MVDEYGRVGAMAAQRGFDSRAAYQTFEPVEAESRLRGSELAEYRDALKTLNERFKFKSGGKIKHKKKVLKRHQSAIDEVSRLRELAAARAFGDFSSAAMQRSKPWLMQQPEEGLVREQLAAHTLENLPGFSQTPAATYGLSRPSKRKALGGLHKFGMVDVGAAADYRRRLLSRGVDLGY